MLIYIIEFECFLIIILNWYMASIEVTEINGKFVSMRKLPWT